MKTKDLIKKVNVVKGLAAYDEGHRLTFYEIGQTFPFYTMDKKNVDFGQGDSNFRNLRDANITRVICVIDAIREYLETPLNEREEPKLYNVKFPAITRDGKPIYLARHTGENDRIGVDWSSKGYIEKIKSQFAFTEQEIKDINASYWEFAEEVTE